MILVRDYVDEIGRRPFRHWVDNLHAEAARKIDTALYRIEQQNLSNVKGVGKGVFEYRINYGPGYRIYFGKDGDSIVILLGGGTKQHQQRDIETAIIRWVDYKKRKET